MKLRNIAVLAVVAVVSLLIGMVIEHRVLENAIEAIIKASACESAPATTIHQSGVPLPPTWRAP